MTYQETYQTWLDFADLPDYLREELVAMDEKQKKMPSIQTWSSVRPVCVVYWRWYQPHQRIRSPSSY